MREPYPEISPYRSGLAEVGEGHRVYWEECGNPEGKSALVLHGGPGSGCSPGNRRYYDPSKYRIVLLDQRNSGRSRPLASEPDVDFTHNTTAHLVRDLEFLREMLGIEKWMIQGSSWGSVLALVYAETYPERVSELLLVSMGTGRQMETDLLTEGLGKMFPEAWSQLEEFSRRADGMNVIDRYHKLLMDPDPAIRDEAAIRWCAWETAILPTAPAPSPRYDSPEFRLGFARVVTHYWRNGCFIEDGQVLANVDRLSGIRGVILQGRLDLSNLSGSPWELAAKWPGCVLEFIDDAGHEGNQRFRERILYYTDRFAAR